jgi:hypothetical protein
MYVEYIMSHDWFGPLNKNSCGYFYAISVMFMILFLISCIILIVTTIALIMNYNNKSEFKQNMVVIGVTSIYAITYFVAYFVNRLLNTICVKVL